MSYHETTEPTPARSGRITCSRVAFVAESNDYWLRETAIKLFLWSNACTDHASLPFTFVNETLVERMTPWRALSVLCGRPFTKTSTREMRFFLSRGRTFEDAAMFRTLFRPFKDVTESE